MPSPPQDDHRAKSRSAPSAEDAGAEDLRKRLTDEYKILQDKMDKIGGFRFTIKGWSVTAVIAATAAASTVRSLLTTATISFGLAALLVFFFFFEMEQVRLSWLFGNRARRLEDAFIRMDRPRSKLQRPFPVPYIANEVVMAARGARRRTAADPPRRILWRNADIYFYVVLLFLALMPLAPHYAQIGERMIQLSVALRHAVRPDASSGGAKK